MNKHKERMVVGENSDSYSAFLSILIIIIIIIIIITLAKLSQKTFTSAPSIYRHKKYKT